MTDESICVRCAELIRMRFKEYEEEVRICSLSAMEMGDEATVQECSRFEAAVAAEEMPGSPGKVAPRSPRPRYLPHDVEERR